MISDMDAKLPRGVGYIGGLLAIVVAACTTQVGTPGEGGGGRPDAGVARADAEPPAQEPDAGPVIPDGDPIAMSASASNTITPNNSISCNSGAPNFFHSENHYYRSYPLSSYGVVSDLTVTSVDVGIQEAAAASGSQPITIALSYEEGLNPRVDLESKSLNVNNQGLAIVNVPIVATVPAGTTLVVEVITPNGTLAGNRFFIGSNTGAEQTQSLISTPDPACNAPNPTPIVQLGATMSLVLNVNGVHQAP